MLQNLTRLQVATAAALNLVRTLQRA